MFCKIDINNKTKKCYDLTKEKHYKQCTTISFMIFRTGSVLIVGHCNEEILNVVYEYLKNILTNEYDNIYQKNDEIETNNIKIKDIKTKKKKILVSI